MVKWYEQINNSKPNILYSRIRLARNWNEYVFPSRLSQDKSIEMIGRLKAGLTDIGSLDKRLYTCQNFDEMPELLRLTLKERRVLNESLAVQKAPGALILSDTEDASLVLGGADHIRIQLLEQGFMLEELWKQANQMDDYINDRFDYCFDEKYGYLTSYPTNVGTGMRACVVLHLPTLSLGKKFGNLTGSMGRFGASVKGLYGEGSENYGAMYEVSNMVTLGRSEAEIIALVNKVALQLYRQECQVRELSLKNHRLEREDESYKSYGVLKYARRLSMKDAMIFLSQFMAGLNDELLKTAEPCSVYQMMLGIQTAHLSLLSDRPLGKDELDVARASYLRKALPELI